MLGHLVYPALERHICCMIKGSTAEVINIHTIKPLDNKAFRFGNENKMCCYGGRAFVERRLGDSIAQLLVRNYPVPQEYVAMEDRFGISGKPEEVLSCFGLDKEHIFNASLKAVKEKINTIKTIGMPYRE